MVLCLAPRRLDLRTDLLTRTEDCSLSRIWRVVVTFLVRLRDSGRLVLTLSPVRILDVSGSLRSILVIVRFRLVRILPAIGAFGVSLRVLVLVTVLSTLSRPPVTMVVSVLLLRVSSCTVETGSFLSTIGLVIREVLALVVLLRRCSFYSIYSLLKLWGGGKGLVAATPVAAQFLPQVQVVNLHFCQ